MSRPLRIKYPGAWYHIMNRGRRSEEIFLDGDDYKRFLGILIDSIEMWNVRISAYCLLPNHYHILINTPEGNISRCMRHINGVYTQRFNRVHGCDGQLFRGRFKSILVSGDSYLLQLVRYIHKNPLRAGMVERLNDYQWSSHKGYASVAKKWDWLHKDLILSMLSGAKGKRLSAYKRFMNENDEEKITRFFKNKKLPAFMGSDDFITWLKETFFLEKKDAMVPESVGLAPGLSRIRRIVSEYYQIDEAEISNTRRGILNEPRNVVIYLVRRIRRDDLLTISRAFGMSGYSSVSSAVDRIRKRMSEDRQFKRHIDEITRMIIKGQMKT